MLYDKSLSYDMNNPFQNSHCNFVGNSYRKTQISKKNDRVINQNQICYQKIVLQKMRKELLQSTSKQYDYINNNNSLQLHKQINGSNFILSSNGNFYSMQFPRNFIKDFQKTQNNVDLYKMGMNNPFQKQLEAKKNYQERKINKVLNFTTKYSQYIHQQPIKLNKNIFDIQSIQAQRQLRNMIHQQNFMEFKQLKKKQNIKKKLQKQQFQKQKLKLKELRQNFIKLKKIQSKYQNGGRNILLQQSKSSRESQSMLFNLSSSRRKLQSLFSFGMDGKGNSDFLFQESLRKRQFDFDDFDEIQGKKYPKTIMHRKKRFQLIKFSN